MTDRARPTGLIGPPTAHASLAYRVTLSMAHAIGRGVFGFRIEVRGRAHLPRDAAGRPTGGWIAAGLPHRTWVDPFVVADSLPIEPRLVFFGDGRAIFRSAWRRWLVRRVGGVIPIWPGGDRAAIDAYLAAAALALDAGAVLCLFPETGPATAAGHCSSVRVGPGVLRASDRRPDRAARPGREPRALSGPAPPARYPGTCHVADPRGRVRRTPCARAVVVCGTPGRASSVARAA